MGRSVDFYTPMVGNFVQLDSNDHYHQKFPFSFFEYCFSNPRLPIAVMAFLVQLLSVSESFQK